MPPASALVAFAAASNFDPDTLVSSVVGIEWPLRSAPRLEVPEIDATRWMSTDDAKTMMLASQLPYLERLGAAQNTEA